jgi:plastocyanin
MSVWSYGSNVVRHLYDSLSLCSQQTRRAFVIVGLVINLAVGEITFMHIRRFFGIIMLSAALVLSACAGGAAEPTTAPATQAPVQATELATAAPVAQATPTFETAIDLEPSVPALQASGTLAWRDQVLRNDAVIVAVTGLQPPPTGQVYAAWLSGQQDSLPLGALNVSSGTATLTYVSPNQENLLGKYERAYIIQAPEAEVQTSVSNVIMSGALPSQALAPMREILVAGQTSPGKLGHAIGLRQETDELLRHAQFLQDGYDAGDFALVKLHAEHITNIIVGSQGDGFGDGNGDGRAQNPGDGFGLQQNGGQDGYIKAVTDHAQLAATAGDSTADIKLHAGHVQIAAQNTLTRVQDIRERSRKILAAGAIAETQQDVLNILALSQQTIQGIDANLDEQVGPIPGEGGVLTAYQHAQLMAGVSLATGAAAGAPSPVAQAPAVGAPVAQAFTVDMGDNTYTPNKITVPVGATVSWPQKGQRPHTVTADDSSFDSGQLDPGAAAFQFTFEEPGTYPYFCTLHGGKGGEGMAGSIIVAEQSAAAQLPPAQPAAAPAPAQPAGNALAVGVGDNFFDPKDINVPVGGKVVWTHNGQRPHTVTANNGAFDSGQMAAGQTFEQTFSTAGEFPYFCEFHEGMVGTIRVGGGGGAVSQPDQPAQPAPNQAPPPPTQAPAQAAPPPPAANAQTIDIGDNTFTSNDLTVPVGTKVVWTHKGQRPHTVTAKDQSFNSGQMANAQTFEQTFSAPGEYPYFCEFHEGMEGVIRVGDAGAAPPAQPALAAAEVTVSMKDFDFEPLDIRVKAGSTVIWKNDGAKPHSARAVDDSFDTTVFNSGLSKSVTFTQAGEFPYYCELHGTPDGKSGMVGNVIVEP